MGGWVGVTSTGSGAEHVDDELELVGGEVLDHGVPDDGADLCFGWMGG